MMAAATQNLVAIGLRAEKRAWDRVRHDALLDAGVNAAVFGLMTSAQGDQWRMDGVPREFAFEGQTLRIAIQDERGRIDLNSADGSIFKKLFLSVGVTEAAADDLVANILDWRSGGVGPSNTAAESHYRALGYRPRHGAFQSVDELKLVLGVSRELYERVAPALTVYSRLPLIDYSIAPREVLLAMKRVGQDIDEVLTARLAGMTQGSQAEVPPATVSPTLSLIGRTFSIAVEAMDANDSRKRTAVVLLTGDDTNPYLVLSWR
jgi:general secretion pathway protein K